MSDAALLAACAVGDSAALGALFDRFRESVERYLSRLQRTSEADLDDLVQATFLTVQRAAGSYRGRGSVGSFILGIATNVVRHHVRSENRRRAMMVVYAKADPLPPASPGETAEHREILHRAQEALQALPEELRAVFVLAELEGLPGAEVARILNLREGTVWRRLHNARKALRKALEGLGT
jgi:RNA polymerase sigma-70 factor (ECF subfamily)